MGDQEDSGPVGFMGMVRGMKVITWVLIIGVILLATGGTVFSFILQGLF